MVKLTEEMILSRTRVADLGSVKKLNCWGADLTDISILSKLVNVEILSLSVNGITQLADVASCTRLQELYVRKNNIDDVRQICWLRDLTKLKHLWLEDNPCVATMGDKYRLTVIRNLPQLQKLDNISIHADEVGQALRHAPDLAVASPRHARQQMQSQRERRGASTVQPPAPVTTQQAISYVITSDGSALTMAPRLSSMSTTSSAMANVAASNVTSTERCDVASDVQFFLTHATTTAVAADGGGGRRGSDATAATSDGSSSGCSTVTFDVATGGGGVARDNDIGVKCGDYGYDDVDVDNDINDDGGGRLVVADDRAILMTSDGGQGRRPAMRRPRSSGQLQSLQHMGASTGSDATTVVSGGYGGVHGGDVSTPLRSGSIIPPPTPIAAAAAATTLSRSLSASSCCSDVLDDLATYPVGVHHSHTVQLQQQQQQHQHYPLGHHFVDASTASQRSTMTTRDSMTLLPSPLASSSSAASSSCCSQSRARAWVASGGNGPTAAATVSLPRIPRNRNSNILSAVLCLIKELDAPSLEVVELNVRCRINELEEISAAAAAAAASAPGVAIASGRMANAARPLCPDDD